MNTAVDVLLLVTTLFVGVWVALFGTAGAMLNRRRGRSNIAGLLIGTLFGPFGLAYLAWRSREPTGAVAPTPAASHIVQPSTAVPPPPAPPPPPPTESSL